MSSRKRLYLVPPGEFTAARNQLARELKEAGQKEEAALVAKLRKPTAALWLVNAAAREDAPAARALIEATARAGSAQAAALHGRGGDELREAMAKQREALQKLVSKAEALAREHALGFPQAVQRKVQATLQAAAAQDPEALREAELESELEPGGFENVFSGGHAPLPEPAPRKDELAERRKAAEERARRERALQQAEQEAAKAEEKAARLERDASELEERSRAAREAADDARREARESAARALELRRNQ